MLEGNRTSRTSGAADGRRSRSPGLPSLSGLLIGSVLFLTGGMLMFTLIGTPLGILLFVAGLGLMLTPGGREP